MVIYGNRSVKNKVELESHLECPQCNKIGGIEFTTFVEYYHIFFIPVIPTGKNGLAQCSYCGMLQNSINISKTLKPRMDAVIRRSMPPFWMYIGLPLFLLGIFFFVKNTFFKSPEEKAIIAVAACMENIQPMMVFEVQYKDENGEEVKRKIKITSLIRNKENTANAKIKFVEGKTIVILNAQLPATDVYQEEIKETSLEEFKQLNILNCN